ncbi:glycerophosphodiester phosphodiesterase family protein [Microvirga sp. CF3016]|uniref:glycerophosphodiester phosphodiesterase family protein n=1 Tax=Microvirga sp. CF3016 TaxID=3110181 RepID=UPI002E791386|nr:glycerophosphodiester phosphodiesterase family protein [Microvirga sp. CF3016]MEE1611541.1 glycerophosphodiester phosphodiesterase family protein [Microvirga sp. CF3016]
MSTPSWLVAKPIAHRGLHNKAEGIIENTISAAEAAIARSFPIELDVQLTADNEAIVFHDFELDRLTGQTGLVAERKLSELSGIEIAGAKGGDKIPAFTRYLGTIAGRTPLIVEIKSRFNGDMRLTKRVIEILAGYSGPFVVKSFDPDIVAFLRQHAPDITRGFIGELEYASKADSFLTPEKKHRMANLLDFEEMQPHFLSWRVKDIPCASTHLSRILSSLPVMTWTVRTPEDRSHAEKHADQMVFEGFLP